MKTEDELMRDNPALVHEIKCWREEGVTFAELAEGIAKGAIEDYSPALVTVLERLTDPKK